MSTSAEPSVCSLDNGAEPCEALMQFLYRAPVGLVQTTLAGDIEMINPMSANLLLPLSVDGNLNNLFESLDRLAPQLRRLVGEFMPPAGTICEGLRLRLETAGNDRGPQVLSLSLLKLDPFRLMALVTDATLEVQREQNGLHLSRIAASRVDLLTDMPNRTVACEVLHEAIQRKAPAPGCDLAVLFINCDRFKLINDSRGHVVGDAVLCQLGERLKSAIRQQNRAQGGVRMDSLAARIGGDEFTVVLCDLRYPDDVHAVVQRLLNVLALPYEGEAAGVQCSVSVGVVLRPQVRGDAETVLQDANTAMLEAKHTGGGRYVVFAPEMHERAAYRRATESDLRRAILEEELFVVYQPVVDLQGTDFRTDRAAGVEALVRWRHPTRGIVPPVEFIAIAEECGLIGALGDFVLGAACRQFVSWQRELKSRAPRLLAVNLSRNQLSQPGFCGSVEYLLKRSGIEPWRLQLEVTESLAAQDESVRTRLEELKSLGLTLALDDFGTGYSSLSSLHQLPVDTIKIDRSFVTDAVTSAHHRVLIEATVRVATSLGMSTVAEGIETREQAAVVRSLGCKKGQGYYFSRPQAAEALTAWLQAEETSEVTICHQPHPAMQSG